MQNIVVVTQEDINIAIQETRVKRNEWALNCPIAQAFCRVDDRFLCVISNKIVIIADGKEVDIKLPAVVQGFIYRFDKELPVFPFSFVLDY